MNIYLDSNSGRNIARSMWGNVNMTRNLLFPGSSRKTTGFYYYSCANHGGYIVDGNALLPRERARIDTVATPELVYVEINRQGDFVKMSNPYSPCNFRYNLGSTLIENHPIFIFEEDEAWAVIELVTGIRPKDAMERLGADGRLAEILKSIKISHPMLLEERK